MQKLKMLLVEDEEDIADLVRLQAEMLGYKFSHASDGLNGFESIKREKPDIVVLDIMLPGQNGLDVCRKVKSDQDLKHIPIIMLSARSEETDVVLGLELGADDFVTKPFSPRVLFSRIKAILRRNQEEEKVSKTIHWGDFSVNLEEYIIKKKDKTIPLTLSEFGILKRLVLSKGKVFTRNQLLDELQSDDSFVVDRNIDVHIAALRKKLGPNFDSIETVRGVGYRFRNDD